MLITRLTPQERANLQAVAVRAGRHRPNRERIRVVTFTTPEPKPMSPVEYDDWQHEVVGEIAGQGMPPGPELNIATRAQRRQVYRELVALVIIGVLAVFGALLVIWSLAAMVRVAIG